MSTDAEVFDALHSAYGVGKQEPGEPWFKFRARQIGMLRRIRVARKLEPDDLMKALEYARGNGRDLRHVMALVDLVPEARAWVRRQETAAQEAELDRQVGDAVTWELERDPDSEWAQHLIRSAGPARARLYAEWRATRWAEQG